MRVVLGAVVVLLAGCSPRVDLSRAAPATLGTEPPGYEIATVTEVIDGDTIEVAVLERAEGPGAGDAQPGRRYDVRLLGIDTPETVDPEEPVECFGREASAAAKVFLAGRRVRLVADAEETDQYGRLLRYVYVGAELSSARLVVNGYAEALAYEPNVRHEDLLGALEDYARVRDLGMWHPDTCADAPT